ncbi:NfeD family protein [Fusibacter bizertensis]
MEKFYLYVAVPASLILIVQSLMTLLGLSGEIDVDYDGDGDVDMIGETGLTLFSIRNIVAFFTFFGWSGLWLLNRGTSYLMTAFISFLIGFVFMLISMGLFFLVSKMQRNGTMNLQNAVGKTGEVYIPIPSHRQSYGKVMIVIQGTLSEIEAITDEDESLKTGTQIVVVEVVDQSRLLVKKNLANGGKHVT